VVARRQEPEYDERLWNELRRLQAPDASVRLEHRLEQGNAAETILRVAHEEKCDLIVMATHGRTGLVRLLLGSVAEQVLRQAPCPVLTLGAPAPA
jgi:nucleotide-binding universal stress UspA family protein